MVGCVSGPFPWAMTWRDRRVANTLALKILLGQNRSSGSTQNKPGVLTIAHRGGSYMTHLVSMCLSQFQTDKGVRQKRDGGRARQSSTRGSRAQAPSRHGHVLRSPKRERATRDVHFGEEETRGNQNESSKFNSPLSSSSLTTAVSSLIAAHTPAPVAPSVLSDDPRLHPH